MKKLLAFAVLGMFFVTPAYATGEEEPPPEEEPCGCGVPVINYAEQSLVGTFGSANVAVQESTDNSGGNVALQSQFLTAFSLNKAIQKNGTTVTNGARRGR